MNTKANPSYYGHLWLPRGILYPSERCPTFRSRHFWNFAPFALSESTGGKSQLWLNQSSERTRIILSLAAAFSWLAAGESGAFSWSLTRSLDATNSIRFDPSNFRRLSARTNDLKNRFAWPPNEVFRTNLAAVSRERPIPVLRGHLIQITGEGIIDRLASVDSWQDVVAALPEARSPRGKSEVQFGSTTVASTGIPSGN